MSGVLTLRNRQRSRAVELRVLRRATLALLQDLLRIETFDLGIYLVGAVEMTRLNETFLRHAGSTDVLAFNYGEPARLHGEIFVCVDEAVTQARHFRTTWQQELLRYVIHGLLHLRGYDDQRAAARREMKREEDRLLRQLNFRFDRKISSSRAANWALGRFSAQ